MSMRYLKAITLVAGAAVSFAGAAQDNNGLIQYPSLSPDGDHLVFSAAGDLWSVPVKGGTAVRITSHPGIETQSRFNEDGSMLIFESNRDGAQNIYTMPLEESRDMLLGGEVERVTVSDRAEMLGGLSQDGNSVLFSAYLYPEIYRHPKMYQAPLDGGPITEVTSAFGRGPATHTKSEDVFFIRGYYYPHRVAYRGPGNLDIWKFSPSSNTFTQVTEFDGNDMNPWQRPDGSIVYLSSQDGQYNVYRLDAGGTDQDEKSLRQLTHFAPDEENPTTINHGVRDLSVSHDGKTATFVVWNTIYTLDLRKSKPKPKAVRVTFNADLSQNRIVKKNLSRTVSEAAVHPSGKAVAQVSRGELFIRSTEEGHPTIRVTDTNVRERDIAWSPDGTTLYFAADDEDSLGSIYAATVSLAREDIEPKPEVDEEAVEQEAEAIDESVGEGEAADSGKDTDGDGVDDSPAEPAAEAEGSDDESEEEADKEPEIDYAQRWATALRFEVQPVVQDAGLAYMPKPSPDGKKMMYLRDRGDILIRDLATGDEHVAREQWSEPEVQWASDSRHIVFSAQDLNFNSDIFLLDTQLSDSGELADAVNVSRHPDLDFSPSLSHDGKILSFLSDRDNDNWEFDVYAVYLDRELEGLKSFEIAQYYKDAVAAAKKLKPIDPIESDSDSEEDSNESEALEFDADDAFLRVRRLTSTPESEQGLVMTPGGDRYMFSTVIDGSRSYVSVDYKGKDRKSIKSGGVSDPRVSLDGKSLSYISGGQAATTAPTGGKSTSLAINVSVEIDRLDELAQKFDEASGRFGLSFYHPTMKGLDWEAVSARYRELVMQTRTNQSFLRLMNLMWGEVDGSHTGTWGGEGYSASSPANGYLGVDFAPVDSGYRIDAIIEGGPIDRMKHGPAVGDVLTAIDGTSFVSNSTQAGLVDLHSSLAGLSGDEVLVEFTSTSDDSEDTDRMAMVTPTSYSRMSVLRYNDEVNKRREQVDEMSDGKLGYLHIRSMGAASVRDYERDLFAAADGKDGLIIDVRDNGGGWTTDVLLASLTAPNHAYTIPRGANPDDVRADSYPRDRRLIYAYSRPINVLINQHSFSNAEIFAHSIRTAERGTIIGTQTFGGVISTGSFSLIDGTTVRRPFRGWYLPDGTDMENNGTLPDIDVPQTPTDEAAGEDPQLEAAIKELLGRTTD